MIDLLDSLITYAIPAISGIIVVILTKRKDKSQTEGTDQRPTSGSGPVEYYQKIIDQMQAWTDKRLAERDAKIDRLDKRVTSLESRYRAALHFIRTLLRRHPDSSADIPAEIRHDL